MSISKKLAAVVSAAAVVASMFAAAPASAETTAAFINRTVSNSVDRPIDAVAHTVKFYAGEEFSIYYSANVKSQTLSSKVVANSVLTVDAGYALQSGTITAESYKSIDISGQVGNTSFNDMSARDAAELKLTKTFTAAPSNLNININLSGTATTDVVFVVNPSVKIGDYVLVEEDMQYSELHSASRSGGSYNPESNGKSRVARVEDENFNFYADSGCINTTGLVAGDVLEVTMTVSDGTSNVGTLNPYWNVRSADGMGGGMGEDGSTYTFDALPAGSTVSVNAGVSIDTPVVGKTYTFGELKVVKQGTAENLIIGCTTTAATGTTVAEAQVVTTTIDKSADASGMMPKFDNYVCALYASTDANRTTVVKSSRGYMMMPSGGAGAPVNKCIFKAVPAGTYVVGIRGDSWKGMSEEKIIAGTVTVSGSVTPPVVVKKAPKVPTVATKLKIGKTLTVALHATKGTASKGANADGLPTVVSVATASKAFCSATKVVKAGKITGYTVKGLKAGKCSVVLTVTGSATYNALTKTVAVTVSK